MTKTSTYAFTFTSYQLAVLAALSAGAETSVEIMEAIEDTVDKFARSRCCTTLAALAENDVIDSSMIGETRFAAIRQGTLVAVTTALAAAGLAS